MDIAITCPKSIGITVNHQIYSGTQNDTAMKQINDVWVYDTLAELVDPEHTALLIVDVQNDFCHPEGHFARYGKDLSTTLETLPRLRAFVREGQQLGLRIFFVQQTTLPDGRSDSPAWLRFKTRDGKSPEYTLAGSWGWELDEGLRIGEGDWSITKFRSDAFVHTNLDQMLRANGIETVVVAGLITEGCVESTVRGASYHDFYVVVARDAVASPNAELHEGTMRLFEARYPLATTEEILAEWRAKQNAASG